MADPIKRMHYFDHQFLRVEDFTCEQDYHIAMRRLHNRSLHTWGVAKGLDLSITKDKSQVKVSAGVAVDQDGKEIWLTEEYPIKSDVLSTYKGQTVYITIAYDDEKAELISEGDVSDYKRMAETPDIQCTKTPPDKLIQAGKTLILGRVTVDKKGSAVSLDDGEGDYKRRSAGVSAGDLEVRTLRLSADLPLDEWPALSCSAAKRVDLIGALTVTGNVGIGTTNPDHALQIGDHQTQGTWKLCIAGRGSNDINFRQWSFRTGDGDNSADIHKLRIRDEQADADRLVIDENGNVGIGTTTPRANLHVEGSLRLGATELTETELAILKKLANSQLKVQIRAANGNVLDHYSERFNTGDKNRTIQFRSDQTVDKFTTMTLVIVG